MFSLTEWIIVALIALIVFGVVRTPGSARRKPVALEDLRPREPVAVPTRRGVAVEWALGAGFLLVAAACVLVLVLADAGWV